MQRSLSYIEVRCMLPELWYKLVLLHVMQIPPPPSAHTV